MSVDKEIEDALASMIGKPIDAQTTSEVTQALIPIIRKIMPTVIAQDIIGVQPMASVFEPYKVLSKDNWDFHVTVDVNDEVAAWIWQQPVSEWTSARSFTWPYSRYYISHELLTMLALKWAA